MSFKIHNKETAPTASVPVLAAMEEHIGFIPNIIGVLAESPMAITSVAAINQAIEQSSLNPIEQRVVTVTASAENNCNYCVPAQSTMAKMAEMPDKVLEMIRSKQPLPDEKYEALRSFTLTVLNNNGWVAEPDVQTFIAAGYETKHVLEVITLIALMTLSNYVSHMSSVPLDDQFLPQQWSGDHRKSA